MGTCFSGPGAQHPLPEMLIHNSITPLIIPIFDPEVLLEDPGPSAKFVAHPSTMCPFIILVSYLAEGPLAPGPGCDCYLCTPYYYTTGFFFSPAMFFVLQNLFGWGVIF